MNEYEENEEQLKKVNETLSSQLRLNTIYTETVKRLSQIKLNLLECREHLKEQTE